MATRKRGAPVGNKNAEKDPVWRAAINRALEKRHKGGRAAALDELAEALLNAAKGGDMTALKELGDRLDGKPKQSIDLDAKVAVVPDVSLTMSTMK